MDEVLIPLSTFHLCKYPASTRRRYGYVYFAQIFVKKGKQKATKTLSSFSDQAYYSRLAAEPLYYVDLIGNTFRAN